MLKESSSDGLDLEESSNCKHSENKMGRGGEFQAGRFVESRRSCGNF